MNGIDELLPELEMEEQFLGSIRDWWASPKVPVDRTSRDYIRRAQRALNKSLGFRLADDGIVGRKTRSALREFQRRNNLPVTGRIDQRTGQVLLSAGASSPPAAKGHGLKVAPGERIDLTKLAIGRTTQEIKRQLLRRISASDTRKIAARKQALKEAFESAPGFYSRTLHDRLKLRRKADELSSLFHYRLSTPTREQMLRILRRKADAFQQLSKRQTEEPKACTGGRFLLRYEDGRRQARCIGEKDPELLKNFVGSNIIDFNATIDKARGKIAAFEIVYKDGRTKQFTRQEMAQVPEVRKLDKRIIGAIKPVDEFRMGRDGFVYHIHDGKVTYDAYWSLEILIAMTDLRVRAKALKDLFELGVIAAGFARIIGSVSGLFGVK